MAVTEGRRHRLYTKFEEVIGAEEASTVMELLPPVGWADVATKDQVRADLDTLRISMENSMLSMETRLKTEIGDMRAEIADVKVGLSKDLRTIFITSFTAHTAMTALIVSLAKAF